jgi:hypothetical protein
MIKMRRLVLDVVKPQEPSIIEFASALSSLKGIDGVNVSLIEAERKVENVRITLEGKEMNITDTMNTIEKLGGAIHSIDEAAAGNVLVEPARTLEGK